MKQKVMDAMQSFSKALMGPVLFLPIAGMLQAISSVILLYDQSHLKSQD